MKNWRENFLFFLIILGFLAILIRLSFLQIKKGDYYRALSFGLSTPLFEKKAQRGEIFFRDGEPLAINKFSNFLVILPKKIKDHENLAQNLSQILGKSKEEILEEFQRKEIFFLEFEADTEKIKKIRNLNLNGIWIEEGFKRYYPQKELAANVVGFLGGEGRGQYGVEEFYDSYLKKGKNLTLTLDYKIQFQAEKILKEFHEKLEFERGQILVLNPENGEILAMATFPSFNPNEYTKYAEDLEIFKNPFTQEVYEPGSAFKPVTMAIGLEEKKITPETTYRDPGEIRINGWVIRNYENRKYLGEITMTEVLEKSINTGAVFVQRKLENFVFLDYLKKFGVFEKTGIDLPEIIFENQEIKQGRDINFATASFGQGIALTPIQLAKIYCAIANGGKLIIPHLNKDFPNLEEKRVLSKETTAQLTKMLISVVENGFAKRAKIEGYFIAGKTGTSLQPKEGEKGYSEKTWQSFVGFFPALNPKFLVLIKLDNPKTKTAEYSAVPIFREMTDFIIKIKQIPPDYENL
jgi:cell division protein FtsI/penicillin-binding protein 2